MHRYAGEWYRGCHHGYGVFIAPKLGHQYVGQWAGGKKHGIGRYYFSNGDFYGTQKFMNVYLPSGELLIFFFFLINCNV